MARLGAGRGSRRGPDRALVPVRLESVRHELLAHDPRRARLPALHLVARSGPPAPVALLSRRDVRILGKWRAGPGCRWPGARWRLGRLAARAVGDRADYLGAA